FFERLNGPPYVLEHKDRGTLLAYLVLVLLVVIVVAVFTLGGPSPIPGSRQHLGAGRPVQLVVGVVTVVVALVVVVQAVRTGDAGARAVWGALPQSSDVLDASNLR